MVAIVAMVFVAMFFKITLSMFKCMCRLHGTFEEFMPSVKRNKEQGSEHTQTKRKSPGAWRRSGG